jgi:hypothetical protein
LIPFRAQKEANMSGRRLRAMGATTLTVTFAVMVVGGGASASSNAVPQSIVGCWKRHVPALPVGTSAGVWLVQITRAGRLNAYPPGTTNCGGSADFASTVTVAGSRFTIGKVPVCVLPGAYSWKATATTLTLHTTSDPSCSPRRILFSGVWTRR